MIIKTESEALNWKLCARKRWVTGGWVEQSYSIVSDGNEEALTNKEKAKLLLNGKGKKIHMCEKNESKLRKEETSNAR